MHAVGYLIGSGSMTLGVMRAKLNVHAVLETPGYDKNAESFRLNYPDIPMGVLPLDPDDRFFEQMKGIDLIFGNPPCGGVSSMTESRLESETNVCMQKWMPMVLRAKPRLLLMENGYQLLADRMKPLLASLTGPLEDAGYVWWTWDVYGHQVGCPQKRRRAFLCAAHFTEVLAHPELMELTDLPHPRTKGLTPCGPFLEDLTGVEPSPEPVRRKGGHDLISDHWWHVPDRIIREGLLAHEHRERLKKRYLTTKEMNALEAQALRGDKAAARQLLRHTELGRHWPECPTPFGCPLFRRPNVIDAAEAAPTIISEFNQLHPTDPRFLTMREHARLMGYPDHFRFHAPRPHLIAQGVATVTTAWAVNRMLDIVGRRQDEHAA